MHTAVTQILLGAFTAFTICFIVWVLAGHRGGSGSHYTIIARQGENGIQWEPPVVAPGPHNHDEEIQRALELHVLEQHDAHTHDDLVNQQAFAALQRQVDGNGAEIRELRRRHNRLQRVRIASALPLDVIFAVVGAVVGVIVAALCPSRLYSYPTVTKVFVNGSVAKVSHQLAQNHWVLGGIILAGAFVGFVIGRTLQYVFGQTQVVAEEVQQ